MVVAAVPRIYMGDTRKRYSSHSPLLPSGKQLLRFHIAKRGKKGSSKFFLPAFFTVQAASITHMEGMSGFPWMAVPLLFSLLTKQISRFA